MMAQREPRRGRIHNWTGIHWRGNVTLELVLSKNSFKDLRKCRAAPTIRKKLDRHKNYIVFSIAI